MYIFFGLMRQTIFITLKLKAELDITDKRHVCTSQHYDSWYVEVDKFKIALCCTRHSEVENGISMMVYSYGLYLRWRLCTSNLKAVVLIDEMTSNAV